MGVASGCGGKEVYVFQFSSYYLSLLLYYLFFFAASSLLFVMFFILVIIMPWWNAHGLQSKLLITPLSE